ncbi:nitrate reductase associated protein [Variovorax sp. Varisp36]|uniref:nitrate reductase associated protein n=1 Tax=Variovorax sp. Varisp36 TaxID=3243031 RepID=UPI0039A67EEE
MRPDVEPTVCLDFEAAQAKSLEWLPLAVRFKLDKTHLTFTLKEWQTLSVAMRRELLFAPLARGHSGFACRAAKAGASTDARFLPVGNESAAEKQEPSSFVLAPTGN